MKDKILVINTSNDISKWDYNCFIKIKSKTGKYFLRELKFPASHYFDSEMELEEGLKRGLVLFFLFTQLFSFY